MNGKLEGFYSSRRELVSQFVFSWLCHAYACSKKLLSKECFNTFSGQIFGKGSSLIPTQQKMVT